METLYALNYDLIFGFVTFVFFVFFPEKAIEWD
jgi:hypothetical protein